MAFHSAMYRENMYNGNIEFVPIVVKAALADSFDIEKKGASYIDFTLCIYKYNAGTVL